MSKKNSKTTKKQPHPSAKGGFQDNPQNINKKGRPPRGWSWAEILEEVAEQVEPKSGKKFKELVSKRIWVKAVNGDMSAMKEIMNRMDGFPKSSTDVTSDGEKIEGIVVFKPSVKSDE